MPESHAPPTVVRTSLTTLMVQFLSSVGATMVSLEIWRGILRALLGAHVLRLLALLIAKAIRTVHARLDTPDL